MQSAIVDEDTSADGIIDSGLICLISLLRLHGIATDVATLRHRTGLKPVCASRADIVRQARRHGLKSRLLEFRSWTNLAGTPLPAIAARRDSTGFFIIVRLVDDKVLILDGHTQKPELLTRDVLESIWDGSLILITKRASLSDIGGQFWTCFGKVESSLL